MPDNESKIREIIELVNSLDLDRLRALGDLLTKVIDLLERLQGLDPTTVTILLTGLVRQLK